LEIGAIMDLSKIFKLFYKLVEPLEKNEKTKEDWKTLAKLIFGPEFYAQNLLLRDACGFYGPVVWKEKKKFFKNNHVTN
jgi:hypothetical protein